MSDKRLALSEALEFVVDNRGKNPPLSAEGYPVIEGNAITNTDRFPRYDKIRKFVSKPTYDNWFRKGHPKVNDVLFVTVGGIGSVALMDTTEACIAQNIIGLRFRKEYDPRFYYYYFRQSQMSEFFKLLDISSVQPSIKVPHLLETQVPVLDFHEQQLIAEMLSRLDDKLDLIGRQNKTLEALAETLFRQWFVEEAEENWETKTVSDVASINELGVGKDYSFKEIEYLDTGSITDNIVNEYQSLDLSDAPSRARRIVRNDDIIISLVRPIQRHYGILKSTNPNTVVSTGFCVVSCTGIDPHFIYLLLTQKEMTESLDAIAEGSTSAYPSLKPSDIAAIEFKMPAAEVLREFSLFASFAWKKMEANRKQAYTLSHLRDTLLPKLMNGEARVEI